MVIVVFMTSRATLTQARLGEGVLLLPVSTNFLYDMMYMNLCFVKVMLEIRGMFDTQCFVPVFNVLVNGVLSDGIVTLGACCDKLGQRRRLCQCLLNGNTAGTRTRTPFVHRTVVGSFDPLVTGVSIVKLITFPKAVVNRVLNNDDPGITVGCRVVVVIVAFATSVLSLVVAVSLTSHGSFSTCNGLLPIVMRGGKGGRRGWLRQ